MAVHFQTMNLAQWLAPNEPNRNILDGQYPQGNLPSVQELVAWTGAGNKLYVAWQSPKGATPVRYRLFYDGQKVEEVSPKASLPIVINRTQHACQNVSVIAEYAEGVSEPAIAFVPMAIDTRPIQGVVVKDGLVTWSQSALAEVWSFAQEIQTNELQKGGNVQVPAFFYTAVRYGTDQLHRAAMWGKVISALRFVPISKSAIPSVYIKQGDRTYTQRIDLPETLGQLTEVRLQTPFHISEDEPLFVGIRFRGDTQGDFVAMTSQPRKLSRSMLASLDGKNWFEYITLKHSLALEVVACDTAPEGKPIVEISRSEAPCHFPQIVGYSIRYKGEEIAKVDASANGSYQDNKPQLHPDPSLYEVFPILSDQNTIGIEAPVLPASSSRFTLADGTLFVQSSEDIRNVALLDAEGKILVLGSPDKLQGYRLVSGTYILRISLRNGCVEVAKVLVP